MVSIICRSYRSGSNYCLNRIPEVFSDVFPPVLVKCIFEKVQVTLTIKGYNADEKKLLQLWNVIIQVSTWNLLWSRCQVSGKQRLLTSWLNHDQGTCHIENLKQAPFGGSRGHSLCVEERKHVPNSPFNHIVHVENISHFCTVGFGSDGTKNFHVLISGTLSGWLFSSLSLYTAQFSLRVRYLVV